MPIYEFTCPQGHSHDERRAVNDRNAAAQCGVCGGSLRRVYSVPEILWPRALNHTWSEIYPDISPREMARRKDIERYDPTMPHKPTLPAVNLRPHIPDRAEAEGATERLKLKPVPEEQAYL